MDKNMNPAKHFLQRDVRLQLGGLLSEVQTAYVTMGTLASNGRNAVLVTHGYTSGPEMLDANAETAEGAWDGIVGPGRPIDTDRYFVVCPNVLGSSFGSTNAASNDPATGQPYGSRFPDITIGDIVAGQKALLDHLGVKHLVAVIGPSLGGAQVFQWGVDHPDHMDALVPVLCAPAMPQANVAELEAKLAGDPHWRGGDYYGSNRAMTEFLTANRIASLSAFGIDALLATRFPQPGATAAEVRRLARRWAEKFDANSLLILLKAIARFDVTDRLDQVRAPLLYVLSRTDRLFPPTLAAQVMPQLERAGVDVRYFEIDSEHGHFASGTDAAKWAPALREFLAEFSPHAVRTRSPE
jgi:homoserine O-acetyltransferase